MYPFGDSGCERRPVVFPNNNIASSAEHPAFWFRARHADEDEERAKLEKSDAVTLRAIAALHAHEAHLLAMFRIALLASLLTL